MSRPISFRAWDKEKQFMDDFPRSVTGDLNMYLDGENDCYAWMQFTGLLDKNGKEIYEGDILGTRGDDWTPEEEAVTVVEWDVRNARFRYSTWAPRDDDEDIYGWKYVEVIGNIYENPDLLKDSK